MIKRTWDQMSADYLEVPDCDEQCWKFIRRGSHEKVSIPKPVLDSSYCTDCPSNVALTHHPLWIGNFTQLYHILWIGTVTPLDHLLWTGDASISTEKPKGIQWIFIC
ncbi:hypothetical protein HDV02_005927 [Globomyces sp. JEL0801]|nr:hypothetical protein HDV02_005927 [Globomyces sp. JEL0801]